MNDRGDAFGVLLWGLKKYAWVVIAAVIALGLLLPLLLTRGADVYEARAQVGPAAPLTLQNLDPLPRLGGTLFENGAVAQAVRQDLQLSASVAVVPSRAELVSAQDNIIFTVIGRAADAETAKRVADTAAAAFTAELNNYTESVGEFEIQRAADVPTSPLPTLGGTDPMLLGAAAGLVAGIGVVALIVVWRRPVIESVGAADATGVPVLGRVRLPSSRRATATASGIAPVCRRLLTGTGELVLLASAPSADRERHGLASALASALTAVRHVTVVPGGDLAAYYSALQRTTTSAGGYAPLELVIVDGPTVDEVATRPEESVTVLVIKRGASLASLRKNAEEYLDGGASGLVLVERTKWYHVSSLGRRGRTAPRSPSGRSAEPAPTNVPFSAGTPSAAGTTSVAADRAAATRSQQL